MALKKDKEKVLDEVWTQDRVKDFLTVQPAEGFNTDYHAVLKAYQSMRLENFSEFIDFFITDGRDINAQGPDGETVLSIIKQHRNGGEYVEVLEGKGAK